MWTLFYVLFLVSADSKLPNNLTSGTIPNLQDEKHCLAIASAMAEELTTNVTTPYIRCLPNGSYKITAK